MTDLDDAGPPARRALDARLGIALALAAVGLPLLLVAIDPAILSSSYGARTVVFELFGFSAAAALASVAALRWRAAGGASWQERLLACAPLLVGLQYAFLIAEYSRRPFDYDCYEYAARALLLGKNPYVFGLNYLYPPLTAQAFAGVHTVLAQLANTLGLAADPETLWDMVFYLYQCAQLGLILLLFGLLVRFARCLGLAPAPATALVAVLLLFDNPLLRTLRHGQINLWVLNLSLVTLLWARRRPAWAGLALALAAHIKLYPLVLGLPLLLGGCWRALLWAAAGGVALVGAETRGFSDWTAWGWFADFYGGVYPGEFAYRNNSFHSLAHNTLRLVFGASRRAVAPAVELASSGIAVAAAVWLVWRAVQRSRGERRRRDTTRLAVGSDALAMSLLISQSVWEHHYVLALPLVIQAVALRPQRLGTVALAALLMLGLPTIDLFPLSYHRVVGLLTALWLTTPGREDASPADGGAETSWWR